MVVIRWLWPLSVIKNRIQVVPLASIKTPSVIRIINKRNSNSMFYYCPNVKPTFENLDGLVYPISKRVS